MSRRFILSAPAARDLEKLLDYVHQNNGKDRAKHVADRLDDAFQKLVENPGLGHRREDLTSSSVLFYSVWSWFVIYRADASPLEIARVLHVSGGAQTQPLVGA